MKDTNRTELLDGIRIINILRGRATFTFDKNPEFDRRFSETWCISLRSLYKQFGIKDLKRWEQAGIR